MTMFLSYYLLHIKFSFLAFIKCRFKNELLYAEKVVGCREAGNKDENIAGFIAVLIIKSIKYGPANEMGKIADSRESVYLFYEN